MQKKSRFLGVVCILSGLSVATSCGIRDTNTNMTVPTSGVFQSKWNGFADVLGMHHLEDMPDLTNHKAMEKELSTPPENFQLADDAHNQRQYALVAQTVAGYILAQEPFMQNKKVLSLEPYANVLKQSDASAAQVVPMAIPTKQRNGNWVDLSAVKTFSGLDQNSFFKIYPTINGNVLQDDSKAVCGHVYLMTYETPSNGQNALYRALVSVPAPCNGVADQNQYPLMVFAHGGDAGLTFKEMATLLQENLGKFVVAAPVYPGEPLCTGAFFQGDQSNGYARSCLDKNNNLTEPSIPALGTKSPTRDDTNGLIAMVDAITQMSNPQEPANQDKISFGVNNIFYDQAHDRSLIPFNDDQKMFGLKSIAVADSRGGATLLAAIGRVGVLFALQNGSRGDGNYHPALTNFSGLSLVAAPTSLLVGQFRILVQNFVQGKVFEGLLRLPMVPELNNYFKDYRDAEIGSDQEQAELMNLVGWLGATDMTYLTPYVSIAVRNWTALSLGVSAPGSIVMLHGTQDKIVPFTESLIVKKGMDTLFANIYGPSANHDLFDASVVPPGSQLFSFQSDTAYVNDPKATYHVTDASFMTSHLINPALSAYSQPSETADFFLFGGKIDGLNTPDSVQQQFDLFNNSFAANDPQQRRPYILSNGCNPMKNGSCYLYGLQLQNDNWNQTNRPLYNRTILQDVSGGIPSAMYSGAWDPNAQNNLLSPVDVLSAWVDHSVLSSLGVFQPFG